MLAKLIFSAVCALSRVQSPGYCIAQTVGRRSTVAEYTAINSSVMLAYDEVRSAYHDK